MIDAVGNEVNKGDFILYTTNGYLSPALVETISYGTTKYRWGIGHYNTSMLRSHDHIILIHEQEIKRILNEINDLKYDSDNRMDRTYHEFERLFKYKQDNINEYEN